MNGAVVWELSQTKLEAVYAEETAKHNDSSKTMHFVIHYLHSIFALMIYTHY